MLKPDFLDLDKDGNTKEPMKEAAKDREPMMYGGGILSDDMDMYKREQFKVGNLVSFMRKMQKGSKGKEDLSDDIMERGVTSPQDALKMLEDKEIRMDELKDLLIASGYSKSDVDTFVQKYMEDSAMADMTKEEKALFRKKDFAGLQKLSKKEKEIFNEPMTDEEIDEALDKLRDEFAYGGSVDEEREQYKIGKLVRKALQKKGVQENIPGADALYDNLPMSFRDKVVVAEDALEKLTKEKFKIHEQMMQLRGDKEFGEAMEDVEFRALIKKLDKNGNQINKVTTQLKELGINPRDIGLPRKSKNDGGMLPDEQMEDNYIDFILDEALTEKEEDMLMSKLEQDEDLSMLFDKVIEVASEFAGSGPVEGPGSGVSDSIPARLSDGEFVFTAKAVEEIGADNLMAMMKDAEMKADKRQGMANGGEMDEEENVVVRDVDEPVTQNINVKKTTVDSPAKGIEDEDELTKSIRTNMMMRKSPDHVRS